MERQRMRDHSAAMCASLGVVQNPGAHRSQHLFTHTHFQILQVQQWGSEKSETAKQCDTCMHRASSAHRVPLFVCTEPHLHTVYLLVCTEPPLHTMTLLVHTEPLLHTVCLLVHTEPPLHTMSLLVHTEPPLHTMCLLVTESCVAKLLPQCHSTQLSRQLQTLFLSPK